jgi:DNA-binding FadR family transcriptional regulator
VSNLNNRRERRNRKDSSFRWRFRGNVRDGVFIITPSGNDWTEVDDVQVALKLISILNFHDDIIDAIKSGDWDVIDRVMAAYKRDSD